MNASFASGGLGMGVVFTLKDNFSSPAAQIGREMGKLNTVTETVENKINKSLNGLAIGFGTMAAGISMLAPLKLSLDAAAEAEQTQIAFATLLKSEEQAKKLIQELRHFADTTPFEDNEIIQSGKMLLAYGLKANEITPQLEALGNVAAGLKIPFKELTEVYGKNLAQGRLFARDIMQFQSMGIPIVGALATVLKVSGKSAEETYSSIMKITGQGKIGSKELKAAFDVMGKGQGQFAGLMEKQSTSYIGLKSTMLSYINNAAESIGNVLLPMAKEVTKVFISFFLSVKEFAKTDFGQWIVRITAVLGGVLFVTGGLIASTMLLRLGVLKLVGSLTLETQAIILNTIAKQGYLAGLKQMIVLTYEANKAQILMAAKFILFGAILYGIYKAIDNYNVALSGLAIGIAFYFSPVYGIVATVAAGFMILNKAMNEFSSKSVSDLGKSGGFIGFLEKVGGLLEGVRTVFSSFNSELLTFQLSKSLEEKLAKIGMLDTVKNVGTWLSRFSVLWDGFKNGFSEMFVSLKNIIKDVITFFTPITNSFFKWNDLIKQNTDFISSWKDAGYNAAYVMAGALGFVALAFIGVKLQMLAAFAPMIIAFGAVVGLVYLVQQGFNYLTGSTYKFADALKVGIVIIGASLLITKAYTTALSIKTAVISGYTAVTTIATTIQKAFNIAIAANPIGITILAVAALSVAMYGLYSIMKDVNREEQIRNDISKEVQMRFTDEQLNLDILFGKLKQAKIGSEEYNKVRDELVNKYGEYDKNLKEELKTVEGMAVAYNKLTSEIRKKIEAEVKYEMAKKLTAKNFELQQDIAGGDSKTGVLAYDIYKDVRNVFRKKELSQNQAIIEKLTNELVNPNANVVPSATSKSEGSVSPLLSENTAFSPYATLLSDAKRTQTSNNQPVVVNTVSEKLQTVNLVVDGNIMSSFVANMINNNIIRSTQ